MHVVFGWGTALEDEAVVKLAGIFAISGRFKVLRGYQLHEARGI